MRDKKTGITIEDIEEAILSMKEEGIPAESQPVFVHRRAAPTPNNGKLIQISIVTIFVFSLVGLGYYYFVWNPEPVRPAQESAGNMAAADSSPATQLVADMPEEQAVSLAALATITPVEQDIVQEATNFPPPTAETTAPPSKPAAAARPSAAKSKVESMAERTVPAAAVPTAEYSLQSGAFRLKSSAEKAEKVILKLGYRPEMTTFTKEMEMTRLLVGTFPTPEARSFLASLKRRGVDAFLLKKGDQASVYAGSFSVPARAREQAGRLAAKGITVEEVVVKVPTNMYRITFGSFTDQAAALSAVDLVVATGLEKPLVKRR